MNIVVCIKQVADTEAKIKIAPDGKSLDYSEIKMVLNPYDEYAIEAALQLKEKHGGNVTLLCLGGKAASSAIRTALAMGADAATHLETEAPLFDPFAIATQLAGALKDMNPDIIFCGKQAIDGDNLQVPSMLAEMLGIASATVVVGLESNGTSLSVKREIEGGIEQLELKTPALISCQKGLNEPRYPSLKGIMMAKKKPIDTRPVDLGNGTIELLAFTPPAQRPDGKIVGNGPEAAGELARLLREEAKVF